MNENRDSFTLKDVIFNLLFILLFVFILLWLFPSKSFLNGVVKNNNKTNTNVVFNQNIQTMKDAAISYFTTPRLPNKIGDSVDLTLKQMIDKKLLLSLIDSNGEVCDQGMSYVEITKDKDEYVLKVSLSCSDMEDYILVHLGCYDYCDKDTVCEKQEDTYKYQYKLVTPCKWSADFGAWSNWQTNYIAANANRKVETKVVTDKVNANIKYNCPNGYSYNEVVKKCYKNYETTETKDAEEKINYICEVGYTYNEATKKCVKETTSTVNVPALKNEATYNCNRYPGYTLNETVCTKTIEGSSTIGATAVYSTRYWNETVSQAYTCSKQSCSTKTVRDCSSGTCKYVPQTSCKTVNSTCYRDVDVTQSEQYISGYKCSTGTLSGTSCIISTFTTDTKNADLNPTTYYCADKTYILNGAICSKEVKTVDTKEAIENKTYSCSKYGSDYSLNGIKCTKNVLNADEKDVISTYVCPNGYTLNGTVCSINVIYYRYAEKSCVGGSVDYKWSESEKDEDLINKGYQLTGVKEKVTLK